MNQKEYLEEKTLLEAQQIKLARKFEELKERFIDANIKYQKGDILRHTWDDNVNYSVFVEHWVHFKDDIGSKFCAIKSNGDPLWGFHAYVNTDFGSLEVITKEQYLKETKCMLSL